MGELVKLRRGGGGGYETPWLYDTKPNWLVKIKWDDDKNEMQIKIVHNTPTHIGEVVYLGDKEIRGPSLCPVFRCKVCGRKSSAMNWKRLFMGFVKFYLDKAIENKSKIVVAPPLTTLELTKLYD